MPAPRDKVDPFKYRRGWGASTRLNAAKQVRAAIADADGLLQVTEAVTETMLQLFVADACSFSLLGDGYFRDVVNVGKLAPGDKRFPDMDRLYPEADFPLCTRLLKEAGGYLSTSRESEIYREYQGMWPQMPDGSFLGVPVVAAGQVFGELYLARSANKPPFTPEDMDAARDLATPLGSTLPTLLRAE